MVVEVLLVEFQIILCDIDKIVSKENVCNPHELADGLPRHGGNHICIGDSAGDSGRRSGFCCGDRCGKFPP
jgi:hypothetical protein